MKNRSNSVSIFGKVIITSAFIFASITVFSQFYENFDSKTKASLTAAGWGYYPTSGISLISNSNAYDGRSLFTNAGGGTYEIVATPCMISVSPKDTLDYYFDYITTTGVFYVGIQKATESVPGASLQWLDSFYVTSGWTKAQVSFAPPAYAFRLIYNMNTPGASADKFGIDEVQIRHATALGTCVLMPVQLTSFTANAVSSNTGNNFQVELNWETESETNVNHYAIQRSFDGNNFETVGKIEATGYSNIPLSYSYTDEVSAAFQCYYRLVTVDNDGSTSGSGIEHVVFSTVNNWYYSTGAIYYYGEEDTQVEVYSLSGSRIISTTAATNTTIQLENVSSGIYLVKVGETSLQKILVN